MIHIRLMKSGVEKVVRSEIETLQASMEHMKTLG